VVSSMSEWTDAEETKEELDADEDESFAGELEAEPCLLLSRRGELSWVEVDMFWCESEEDPELSSLPRLD